MTRTTTITLFATPPSERSSSLLISILLHGIASSCLVLAPGYVPRFRNPLTIDVYSFRMVDVSATLPKILEYRANGDSEESEASTDMGSSPLSGEVEEKVKIQTPFKALASNSPSTADGTPSPAGSISLPQAVDQQQTLIQPEAPKDLLLEHLKPIPTILMWTPQEASQVVVASSPSKSAPADLHPSASKPNREPAPAEIDLSSTAFSTAAGVPPPGSTSPVVVHGPGKHLPTIGESSSLPSPMRILSVSDRKRQRGTFAVPFASASMPSLPVPTLVPSNPSTSQGYGNRTDDSSKSPIATPGSPRAASGTGLGSQAAQLAPGSEPGSLSHNQAGHMTAALAQADPGERKVSGLGTGPGASAIQRHITLPQNGQFGAIVVGSAVSNEYPETAAFCAGRTVYTVYLHVGTGKSWILQYSLPVGTQAGLGVRPEAPWPYDLVVPQTNATDYNADSLIVHGFVAVTGRFERLSMLLPAEVATAQDVLNALGKWQFRAARQDGKPTPVEILLIIPAQED